MSIIIERDGNPLFCKLLLTANIYLGIYVLAGLAVLTMQGYSILEFILSKTFFMVMWYKFWGLQFPSFIIADSAYPLSRFLMKPFAHNTALSSLQKHSITPYHAQKLL